MKHIGIFGAAAVAVVVVAAQSGCTVSEGWMNDRPLASNQGRLVLDLVDAPASAVKEIWVTVDKVTAHSDVAGWVTVMSGPALTVDLLRLVDVAQPLGFARLPAGTVTQVRLYLAAAGPQYVVLPDGSEVALKVPSGTQSGVKVHGPWVVSACNNTAVTLDFDGKKSLWVHPTGQQDEWILRPVIRVKKSQVSPAPCGGPEDDAGVADGGSDGGMEENGGDGDDGAGAGCDSDAVCLSGVCVEGACAPGGPGAPCRDGGDCGSQVCQDDGTCAPGTAGGAGTPCQENGQCLSNTCAAGVCEPGGQGALCQVPADCADGFTCSAGVCEPPIG